MSKLSSWKIILLVCVFCAAMAVASPAQTLTTLHSFNITDGASPYAALIQSTDGNFYGTTQQGGANNICPPYNGCGTAFRITPTGTLTTLWSFCAVNLPLVCMDGRSPYAQLLQGTDGNFYGTTQFYGTFLYGTIFRISPSGALYTLHDFAFTDGGQIEARLIQAADGNLYGTTVEGGAYEVGTLFTIIPDGVLSGVLTTLYNFCAQNGCTDGYAPRSPLVQGTDGNFYGTTSFGGTNQQCSTLIGTPTGCGTVFKLTPTVCGLGGCFYALTTLYSFCAQSGCTDGSQPLAGLVQSTDGNFYGTTVLGGANGDYGTVFKITPGGILTTLHSFNITDGRYPRGPLIVGTDGNLYGATNAGGANGENGTVFKIALGGILTTLHSFDGAHGENPTGLIQATDGNFYGTTTAGGAFGYGTVFKLTVQTPQQATQAIINSVNALFSQGVLNRGQDNSLVKELQQAIKLMKTEKNAGAIGALDSFINEVNDLLSSGVLSASQAASLISAAKSVITQLS